MCFDCLGVHVNVTMQVWVDYIDCFMVIYARASCALWIDPRAAGT
jgi:hypothetical protein